MVQTTIAFATLHTDNPLYKGSLALRDAVLRKPLGMAMRPQDTADDAAQWHAVAYNTATQQVLATVSAKLNAEQASAQLRQMAVDASMQSQGLGRALIQYIEDHLHAHGITQIWLKARAEAVGFYQRLGYHCEGDAYEEIGIAHQNMRKHL